MRRRFRKKRRYRKTRYRKYRFGSSAFRRYNGSSSEKKFLDVTQADFSVSATGSISDIGVDLITQGSTANQRIGRKILLTDLYIRLHAYAPSSTALEHCAVRIMVILDKQCNGALPTQADILAGTAFDNFRNLDQSHRFRTLFEKMITLNSTGITTNFDANVYTSPFQSRNIFISLRNLNIPIMYDASTGAIGDLVSNNLIVYTHGHQSIVNISWKLRARYRDN